MGRFGFFTMVAHSETIRALRHKLLPAGIEMGAVASYATSPEDGIKGA
jgi:hypothetical protein